MHECALYSNKYGTLLSTVKTKNEKKYSTTSYSGYICHWHTRPKDAGRNTNLYLKILMQSCLNSSGKEHIHS